MAKNRGFNGTTVTWGGDALGLLRSVNFTNGGAEVDVGTVTKADGTAETVDKWEAGIANRQLDLEIVGSIVQGGATPTPATYGQKATLVFVWNDGTSLDLGTGILTQFDTSGDRNGEIVTSVTFRPSEPDIP